MQTNLTDTGKAGRRTMNFVSVRNTPNRRGADERGSIRRECRYPRAADVVLEPQLGSVLALDQRIRLWPPWLADVAGICFAIGELCCAGAFARRRCAFSVGTLRAPESARFVADATATPWMRKRAIHTVSAALFVLGFLPATTIVGWIADFDAIHAGPYFIDRLGRFL